MSYEQAQANVEIAFDWLNAMRHRDIDTIEGLFHPDLVWVDVADNVACDGREQALAWLRATPNELFDESGSALGSRKAAAPYIEPLAGLDDDVVASRGVVEVDDARDVERGAF